jgi:hypothetical protein
MFDVEHYDEAFTRAQELERPSVPRYLENDCTRFVSSVLMPGRNDLDRSHLADNVVWDDRRSGLGWKVEGREAFIEAHRASTPGIDARQAVIATRGDRCALSRVDVTAKDGFEVSVLAVHELDLSGLLKAAVTIDADDLDAAFDELDERYLASDEPSEADRLSIEMIAGVNARDPSRIRATLADDFALVDRRSVRINTALSAEEYLDQNRTMWDLLAEMRCRIITTEHDPQLGIAQTVGVDHDGNEVMWEIVGVPQVRGGKLARMEFFDIERYDEARARARELEDSSE